MILKELLSVLEPSFVAIGEQTSGKIFFSGNSEKYSDSHYAARRNVTYIKPSNSKTSATIIYVDQI